jgi:hypothetical protein
LVGLFLLVIFAIGFVFTGVIAIPIVLVVFIILYLIDR